MIPLTSLKTQAAASSFWLDNYVNWQFTGESTEDLVVVTKVLHSIEKLVNVLDHQKKIFVRLATDVKSTSDWPSGKIILPPHNLWEQSSFPSFAHIVDLWTAMALHEAGHIILSEQLETVATKETHQFIIMHLVEDFWIERWMIENFPGYQPFLHSFKKHFYGNEIDLGTDLISQKINDLIYAVNRSSYEPVFKESTKALSILLAEWHEAREQNNITTWDRFQIATKIFQLLFPSGLMDETANEIVKEINVKKLNELEPTARSLTQQDAHLEIPSPFLLTGIIKKQQTINFHKQVKEGKKISWAAEQTIDTWLKEDSRFFSQAKKNVDATIIMKPKVTAEGVKMYQTSYERVKPYVIKLREKFKTVNSPQIYEQLYLNQGTLDEDALYRTRFSTNIFKTVEERFDAIDEWEITLLIDESKSTEQPYNSLLKKSQLKRFEVAMDIGVLFVEALKKLKRVQLKVFAFSTASHSNELQLNELYKPSTKNHYGLGMLDPKGATPEFMAIKEINLQMNELGNKQARKLVVIVSDGMPDCYTYGNGESHEREIKNWIKKWTKRNFSFVHISLEETTHASQLYPTSIKFENDYAFLIAKISQFFAKTLRK